MVKITTQYFCDRCNRELDEKPYFSIADLYMVEKLGIEGWKSLDLCKDCKKSFMDWLNTGSEEKINES